MTILLPPTPEALLATVPPDVQAHYAALRRWLAQATAMGSPAARALLRDHERWLLAELLQPGQLRRERLPVAVEASARWRATGVESARFIIGTTLRALRTDPVAALTRWIALAPMPTHVRERLSAMLQAHNAPNAVQFGLARTAQGWTRRLYLEGGNLPVPMHALEWRGRELQERTYRTHDPLDLSVLGPLPRPVQEAWLALLAARVPQPALLREDVTGNARALHVAMRRQPVTALQPELLALGRALNVPAGEAEAWLARLPIGAELTVVALGRAGPLQLNVYVAPNQDDLPQPGPPPGDLRRTPGTVHWPLRDAQTGDWRGWLLFAPPEMPLGHRPAARSAGVQICASSAVPDAAVLAARLAAAVTADQPTLELRMSQAERALVAWLAAAGLKRQS